MQTSCAGPDFTRYGDVLNSVTPVVSGVTNTFKRLFGLPSLTNKVARHFFLGIGHFEFRITRGAQLPHAVQDEYPKASCETALVRLAARSAWSQTHPLDRSSPVVTPETIPQSLTSTMCIQLCVGSGVQLNQREHRKNAGNWQSTVPSELAS